MTMKLWNPDGTTQTIGEYRPSCEPKYLCERLKLAARIYLGKGHKINYATMAASVQTINGVMWIELV